ncbi:MAG: metallophosphoesterase family protein [Deltaproteobacteria bacterium]|nr:metallophosphoesterase family protein [Deltaproteobacteria bacterium]
MRYAIISDVHSNLEAFNAVLEKIDCLGIRDIICLGDIVGYNANPNECVDIVRSRNIKCIMGNHDSRAAGLEGTDNFTDIAKEAIYWTRKQLNQESLLFLKNLPRMLTFDNSRAAAVHGFINNTDRYILTLNDAYENFQLMKVEHLHPAVCFFGHTHRSITYRYIDENIYTAFDIEVRPDTRSLYLINPGAVGQPRDGSPMASFVLYDAEERLVRFFRVQYDIIKTAHKVLNAGLPAALAQRLKIGY